MMITQEILEMLFDELGMDFAAWVDQYGYTPQMSDQEIYGYLPDDIKKMLADLGINASWMHDGM